jgi:hypothetical protein
MLSEQNDVSAISASSQKPIWRILSIVFIVTTLALGGFLTYMLIDKSNSDGEQRQHSVEDGSQDQLDPLAVTAEGGPYFTDDYFIIPSWGVKYKLSDQLVDYQYNFRTGTGTDMNGLTYQFEAIGITASLRDKDELDYFSAGDIASCTLGSISMIYGYSGDHPVMNDELTMEMDGRYISYTGPQSACSHFPSELQDETQVVQILRSILMNPERL